MNEERVANENGIKVVAKKKDLANMAKSFFLERASIVEKAKELSLLLLFQGYAQYSPLPFCRYSQSRSVRGRIGYEADTDDSCLGRLGHHLGDQLVIGLAVGTDMKLRGRAFLGFRCESGSQ